MELFHVPGNYGNPYVRFMDVDYLRDIISYFPLKQNRMLNLNNL